MQADGAYFSTNDSSERSVKQINKEGGAMETLDRKKEILNICLNLFIEKGLSKTSTRDLSSAMKMQSSGMYYYFNSKDELVIACAEEATQRIENALLEAAIETVKTPELMMQQLQTKAIEMAPTMNFFVSVCSDKRYEELIKPVLQKVGKRYEDYCKRFSNILDCRLEEITPYVHMCIIAISNFMIFKEASFVTPQIKAVQLKLEKIVAGKTIISTK